MSNLINKTDKIFIAGHRGMVGSAIERALRSQGYTNIVTRTRTQLDLSEANAVAQFFKAESIKHVFLAAAKVGGIAANSNLPAEFISENLEIQLNVIKQCYKYKIDRLIFLGSSCIYPKESPQPIQENYLLTGPLETTNRPYAIAKIAGIEMCASYNRQYNTKYLAVMPCNLYGKGDRYSHENAHVIPALIQKMHTAKVNQAKHVDLWGTGTPRREFLNCDDLAKATVLLFELDDVRFDALLNHSSGFPLINVGAGYDLSIRELAEKLAHVTGFNGELKFDATKPDGTMQKLMDSSQIQKLGFKADFDFESGLRMAYQDYVDNYALEELSVSLD